VRDARATKLLGIVGGLLAFAGFLLILVAWNGTAHTALVFEQIPYLVSGGQLGTALVGLGGFLYFASWLTVLVQDQRETHRLLGELLVASRAAAAPPIPQQSRLVATTSGDMVHRESCRVVAGRNDLRPGDLATMRACGICNPDEPMTAA
jgi:hypothetical protein